MAGEAGDGRAALAALREHKPELLFLDIQMPLLDGFGMLAEAGAAGLVEEIGQIVFVTAFDEFALKAFEAQAFDYLLKPWAPSRLQKVLERVRREREKQEGGELAEAARSPARR